ncbi:SGNH hydrolase-type esterase domain-containing protein [Aspergillus floccosus]
MVSPGAQNRLFGCWHTIVFFILATTVLSSLGQAIQNLPASILHRADGLRIRDENRVALRIMPLGASITAGYRSTDGNGYRNYLWEQLRYEGWEVDMVGSLRSGDMQDNENEGHYGYRVDQIAEVVKKSYHFQPNLILINAGTNDALQNHNIDTIGDRMNGLLTQLFDAVPGTTIIWSTLLQNTRQPINVETINKQYRKLAAQRRADGDRVVLAEMSQFIKFDQLKDGTHPLDFGYKEMASVWWAAIETAQQAGMFQKPNNADFLKASNTTSKQALNANVSDPDLPYYSAVPQPVSNRGLQAFRDYWHVLLLALTLQLVIRHV